MNPDLPVPASAGLGQPETAAIFGGLAVLLLFVGAYLLVVPSILDRRLRSYVTGVSRERTRGVDELVPGSGPAGLLQNIDRQIARRRMSASTRALLQRAGSSTTVSEFIVIRLISGLVLGFVSAVLLVSRLGLAGTVLALLIALIGLYVPVIVMQIRASQRLIAFESQLPDALDLVAASLQAGSGLGQAYEMIAREMASPMSDEFRTVISEIRLGLSPSEALQNLADRMTSEDVDLVVSSINIQARIGGNLVQVLRTITHTIRERIRIKGEIRVLTSSQRISAFVISLLPPGMAVVMFLLNPTYMSRLFEPGLTRCLLLAGVLMMVAGVFSLRKLTQIEV